MLTGPKTRHFIIMEKLSPPLAALLLFVLMGCSNDNPQQQTLVVEPSSVAASAPFFLHIADIHLDTAFVSTSYGTDSGNDLWAITCQKLDSIIGDKSNPPQFVLCTGDLPAHSNPSSGCGSTSGQDAGDHVGNIGVVMDSIHALFSRHKKVPFFYLPGNNDGLDGDYYSFSDSRQGSLISKFPLDGFPAINVNALNSKAPCLLDTSAFSMGYYTAKPVTGLRLIALNSVIFGQKYHEEDGISHTQAGDTQMTWLTAQLKAAAVAGDKVYIAMHIPPGIDAHGGSAMWFNKNSNSWLNQFLALTSTYQTTITGILFGHTHMDEIRLLYSSTSQQTPVETAISAPSISPYHCNNPGFKLDYYDSKSFELTDFVTCYTTPGAAFYGNSSYRFSSVFGVQGKTIYDCLKNMNTDMINNKMDGIYYVYSPNATANPAKTKNALIVRPAQ